MPHDRAEGNRLLEFYGTECPHCIRVAPVIHEAEQQTGKQVVRLEVWHNEENATAMQRYAEPLTKACGGLLGVPAFYNEATGEALCGEQDLDTLVTWMNGTRRQGKDSHGS